MSTILQAAPIRRENLEALIARLPAESLAYRLISLLRDTEVERWEGVLAEHMREELRIEVKRVTADAEAQLDRG
jgi:hypothetical protein